MRLPDRSSSTTPDISPPMTAAVVNPLNADRRIADPGTMRVVLIQADRFSQERSRAVLSLERDLTIVAECETFRQATPYVDSLEPDIVLADADIADGRDRAFATFLDRLSSRQVGALIVISADERHAFAAFEAGAIDFLRKPLNEDRLQDAIERARTWIRGCDVRADSVMPDTEPREAEQAEPAREAPRERTCLARLAIRVDGRVIFVRTPDIDYFEGAGNYVKVHVGEQCYRLRVTLRELAGRLDPHRFRRIHRSSLVNVDRIKEVQPWFGGDYVVILSSGHQLRVSRTHAPELLRPLQ